MTYRLLLVACLFILGCATTDKHRYTTVSGTGIDENAALQAAFSKAIEQETGTLILSERESQNLKLLKNDILAYSSGYVDDFKIVSSTKNYNSVTVVVDVKVSESKIKNRILTSSSRPKDFDGKKHNQQYGSYLNQRQQSDMLMDQVFQQFPEKAFNINYNSYTIELDSERNAIIKVPFKFSWNHNFLIAVDELFSNIEDVKHMWDDHKGYVIVITRRPGELFGTQNRYRFNDMASIRRLNIILENREPMIRVRALTADKKVVHTGCMTPLYFVNSRNGDKFYRIRASDTTLIGNLDAVGTILVTIPSQLGSVLNSISNVELSVVSKNKCW